MFRLQKRQAESGVVAEYNALRAEILQLMDIQWKVVSLFITSTGALFGFALSSPGRIPLVLIQPFSSYVLCARWMMTKKMIDRAAFYIRTQLSPRVDGGIGYEAWLSEHRQYSLRRIIRLTWSSPTILLFPGLSVLALVMVAFWYPTAALPGNDPRVVFGMAAWGAGVLLSLSSVVLMWRSQKKLGSDVSDSPEDIRDGFLF